MGEQSKCDQLQSQDLAAGGIILFKDFEGFNPGRFFELFHQFLNPNNKNMFQKAKKHECGSFNLHNLEEKSLYVNQPLGKTPLGDMTKKLIEFVGIQRDLHKFTNHSIRSTGITVLEGLGFEDRQISKLSGKHHCI